MTSRWITLTEYILQEERTIPQATGRLTFLLNQIAEAGKIIASHVKKSGLVDIVGKTGVTNVYDEEVQKLDKFSNDLLIDILTQSGHVGLIASEELESPIRVKGYESEYMVFMDPLDGSSNIDTNAPIGTIFSIYHKASDILQPGIKQVAAGYMIYGASVMFVYTCNKKVNGFTLDPSVGSFLLSHPDIKIPEARHEYAINEAYTQIVDDGINKYLESIKRTGKYTLRWVASMVADIHRVLLKGGIFIYPKTGKSPEGKLRLMFEINPLSLLIKRANGLAFAEGKDPLEIKPQSLHQRLPIVMGSKKEVENYITIAS